MKAGKRNKIIQDRRLKRLNLQNNPRKKQSPPKVSKPANDSDPPPLTDEEKAAIKKEVRERLAATKVSEEFLNRVTKHEDWFDRHPEEFAQLLCLIIAICFTVILWDVTR